MVRFMSDMPSLIQIQKRLNQISAEMMDLIEKYKLAAESQFEVIEMAKTNITDQKDYIQFLELSLEGRIYGEAGAALAKAEDEAAELAAASAQTVN